MLRRWGQARETQMAPGNWPAGVRRGAGPCRSRGGRGSLFPAREIVVEKKTKRGFAMTDIRPAIRSFAVLPGRGALEVDAVLSAQEPTLNPELLPARSGSLCRSLPRISPPLPAWRSMTPPCSRSGEHVGGSLILVKKCLHFPRRCGKLSKLMRRVLRSDQGGPLPVWTQGPRYERLQKGRIAKWTSSKHSLSST